MLNLWVSYHAPAIRLCNIVLVSRLSVDGVMGVVAAKEAPLRSQSRTIEEARATREKVSSPKLESPSACRMAQVLQRCEERVVGIVTRVLSLGRKEPRRLRSGEGQSRTNIGRRSLGYHHNPILHCSGCLSHQHQLLQHHDDGRKLVGATFRAMEF
jgi:hypothetical protein